MPSSLKVASGDIRPPAAEPLEFAVDVAVLRSYEQMQLEGEPDLIVELMDLFVGDAPRRVAALRESVTRRDWVSMKREAHSLRGSSSSLGAFQMALICAEFERAEAEEPLANLAGLVGGLELELHRVQQIFLDERQRRSQ